MNNRVVVCMLGLALVGGCSKKKNDDGGAGSAAASTTGSAGKATEGSGAGTEQGSGGGAAGSGSGAATADKPAQDPKLVERGAYLANILGCPFCHMPMTDKGPDFTRPFAGGMEVPEKFGTWRAPNITPSTKTGIGGWSDEEIIAAIREGLRPDGSRLFPIMPYPNYNRMTDDDAKALVAFLRTVPPVDNVVSRASDLKLPQIPVPKAANTPDPVDDPVKHGEYLVTLMHCNNCHAAPGKDGMPDMARPFSGGNELEMPMLGTGKLVASNITSDPETGIGKWTEEQIANSIKTLTRPDGSVIQGPMQFYLAGWSKMDEKDLRAIAAYVKQIPADKNKVAKSTFKPSAPMGPPPGGAGGPPADGSAAGSAAGAAAGSATK